MKNLILAAAITLTATAATARDNIQIAGSSTVLPYASIVAEAFGENFNFPTPVVESGGSGAGQKRLCEGVGETTIDIANSSSIMKEETAKMCKETIGDFAEVRIGYDGIVFAARHSNKGFDAMTEEQLYHALKADSPYTNWSQIDPSLPDQDILVFLPGTKHGTREVFETKVMLAGCKAAGEFDKTIEKKPAEKTCMKVRRDGLSIDIDGDYTETLASMEANRNGIGVFGLSFLLNNTESIYAATISGVEASTETIASGEYPISRPLQFYVKLAHIDVIPGMKEYGLVSDPELAKTQEMVAGF
jgi:phosphate transport system substrate-binding protein